MEPIRLHRGFTLVELLVVLVIIGVLSLVVITSQSKFNKTLVLANTAYDVALSLRSAQTFGIGSRVTSATTVNTGYGLDFVKANQNSFTLFADIYPIVGSNPATLCHTPPALDPVGPDAKPGNCAYDSGQAEKITTYTIGNGIRIVDFCVNNGSWTCALVHPSIPGTLTSLDIVFDRPNANAFITVAINGVQQNFVSSPRYTKACLTLLSVQNTQRYITISPAGEIDASAASCP